MLTKEIAEQKAREYLERYSIGIENYDVWVGEPDKYLLKDRDPEFRWYSHVRFTHKTAQTKITVYVDFAPWKNETSVSKTYFDDLCKKEEKQSTRYQF